MIRTGILTVSDKGFKGERPDTTGPAVRHDIAEKGFLVEYYKILPDEIDLITRELIYICDDLRLDLVFTNGGTGFSERDVTPEATMKVIEKYVPGIGEAMRMESLKTTPRGMLSRGIAGIRKKTLIVNLPGSPRAAVENLEAILPALPHGIEILTGAAGECAR